MIVSGFNYRSLCLARRQKPVLLGEGGVEGMSAHHYDTAEQTAACSILVLELSNKPFVGFPLGTGRVFVQRGLGRVLQAGFRQSQYCTSAIFFFLFVCFVRSVPLLYISEWLRSRAPLLFCLI